MTTPRVVFLGAILGAAALMLAGCAAPVDGSTPDDSPKESQEKLLALLDETQQLIGGDWENQDSGSPRDCELPGSGDTGTTFTGARSQEMPALDDDTVAKVFEFWEGEGFEAGEAGMGVLTSVLGVHPDNKSYYVELRIGEQATQLSGQAACVPGSTLDELERVKKGG